jgi:regulator of replication initiation timing
MSDEASKRRWELLLPSLQAFLADLDFSQFGSKIYQYRMLFKDLRDQILEAHKLETEIERLRFENEALRLENVSLRTGLLSVEFDPPKKKRGKD